MVRASSSAGYHRAGGGRNARSNGVSGMNAVDVTAALCDPERAAAVRRLVPLYRPRSIVYDRLTSLAAQLLEAPLALLTLVEPDRQFLVASHGIPDHLYAARQTPIQYSICQFAVATGRPLVVADTAGAPFLIDHPAVTEFGIGAYAGVPLVTGEGWPVGALCVMDLATREWNDYQMANLAFLARICMDEMRLAGLERRPGTSRPRWPDR